MTKRDKATIGSAILLAVLVIVTAVIAFVLPGNAGAPDTGLIFLCGCIVIVGILSVVFVYLTKVRRGKYEKRLNAEFYQSYEVVRDAVTHSQLSYSIKKDIGNDVLELLLSAQESGKSAEDAIANPEAFAKEILRAYARPGYLALLGMIGAVISFAAIVLCVSVITWLEQTQDNFYNTGIDADIVFFIAAVVLLVLPLTKLLVSSRSSWAFFIPVASGIVFVLTAEMLRKWFYHAEWVRFFLDGTVRMIPNPAALIVYILSIPLLLLIKVWLRKRMFRRKS